MTSVSKRLILSTIQFIFATVLLAFSVHAISIDKYGYGTMVVFVFCVPILSVFYRLGYLILKEKHIDKNIYVVLIAGVMLISIYELAIIKALYEMLILGADLSEYGYDPKGTFEVFLIVLPIWIDLLFLGFYIRKLRKQQTVQSLGDPVAKC